MSEFSLIADYFSQQDLESDNVLLGIGDDAAIVDTTALHQLAISVDTLNEGVHFPLNTNAYDIGWKSLAVNLSDMAAMGAKPLWFTLAISLPEADPEWLCRFSEGLFKIAEQYQVKLIGGDTTRGPLSISVQIFGDYMQERRFLRSAAQVGDKIYVTGFLGDAALGLISLRKKLPLSNDEQDSLLRKLNRPQPRVKEALAFAETVNAAIDISDGLSADLGHILNASQKGARVMVGQLPISSSYRWANNTENAYDLALSGGDDYELCMTISPQNEAKFLAIAENLQCTVNCIGEIEEGSELLLLKADGSVYHLQKQAYEHF